MSVGAELVRAREARGMSVEDVSAATRIRATLIRAIEADDYRLCGGTVYARGHLRSIARAVGADPEPLVAEFDRSTRDEDAVPAPVVSRPAEPEVIARAERRRGPNWAAAMAVALVVICAVAIAGLVHRPSSSSPRHNAAGTTTTPSPSPTPSHPRVASPPPSAVAQLPANTATALVRATSGRTWLQVETIAGRTLFQGLLGPNQTKVFRDAKGLRIVIGNAPAVQLVADNHDFGTPQSSGNVAHVTVQPGGDVQFA